MANKKVNAIATDGTKVPKLAVEIGTALFAEATVPVSSDGKPGVFSMTPIGSHTTVSSATLATVQTLTKPTGATALLVQNTGTTGIRYTIDGTNPAAAVGFKLFASAWEPAMMPCPGASIKVIRESDGAILDYQWMK